MRQRNERLAEPQRYRDKARAQGDVLDDKRTRVIPLQRFRPEDFTFIDDRTARCPQGKTLTVSGTR